jgi:hypothetical protein
MVLDYLSCLHHDSCDESGRAEHQQVEYRSAELHLLYGLDTVY